jgi:hypothetical protein
MEMRRAVVRDNIKLIQLSEWPEALFDLATDPPEIENMMSDNPFEVEALNKLIEEFVRLSEIQRENLAAGVTLELDNDDQLLQRLRGLGYIE